MKVITYYTSQTFRVTAKEQKELEKKHREHWGLPKDYKVTNFDLVETAMREEIIAEETPFGVENEQGGVSF